MAYAVLPDVCDRRKDLLIDECDANMLDMILCDHCEGETDTPEPELSARSIEFVHIGLINCM